MSGCPCSASLGFDWRLDRHLDSTFGACNACGRSSSIAWRDRLPSAPHLFDEKNHPNISTDINSISKSS